MTVLSFFWSIGVKAQESYTTYTMGYLEKEFSIQIGNDAKLYIDVLNMDKTSSQCGLILKAKKADAFIECLDTALKKFVEWKEIAIKNNVKEFRKEVACNCKVEGYFSFSDWQFDMLVMPTFEFLILDGSGTPTPVMMIRTGKLQSGTNQYIDSDGGCIVFKDEKEFRDFITKIKPKTVQDFLSSQPKKEELFK